MFEKAVADREWEISVVLQLFQKASAVEIGEFLEVPKDNALLPSQTLR